MKFIATMLIAYGVDNATAIQMELNKVEQGQAPVVVQAGVVQAAPVSTSGVVVQQQPVQANRGSQGGAAAVGCCACLGGSLLAIVGVICCICVCCGVGIWLIIFLAAASASNWWKCDVESKGSISCTVSSDTCSTDMTTLSGQKISDYYGGIDSIGWYDHFASSVSYLGDLDSDGVNDALIGADNDDDGGWSSGSVYIAFLATDGTVKSSQKISNSYGGLSSYYTIDTYDYFGHSVAYIGDLDGDDVTEIAVGAYYDDDGGSYCGATYVIFLATDGTVKSAQKISQNYGSLSDYIPVALATYDYFGSAVSRMGDLDGDDVPDLVVGASGDNTGKIWSGGAMYVIFMNTDGTVKNANKLNFNSIKDRWTQDISSCSSSLGFGYAISYAGDVDGDDIPDMAVGTYIDDDSHENSGAVHILFMNTDGTIKHEQKLSNLHGALSAQYSLAHSDWFGAAVSYAGDIDGDDVDDLLVAAPGDDDGGYNAGAMYVIALTCEGKVKSAQKISNSYGDFPYTLDYGDAYSDDRMSVAGLGDVNGDGIPDAMWGDQEDDDGGSESGASYVVMLGGCT